MFYGVDGSLVPRSRPDGELFGLAARHTFQPTPIPNIAESYMRLPATRLVYAAMPQQIVWAAPQRDRDVAPARLEFRASAVPSRPATLAKPGDAALHRCGLQGGADHLESPALVKAGALDHRIENGGGELAEDHFDCGVCAEAPINAQRARLLTLTRGLSRPSGM